MRWRAKPFGDSKPVCRVGGDAEDLIGKRHLQVSRNGSVAYTYDYAHLLTQAQMSVSGLTTQPRVILGYNDNGLMTSIARSNAYGSGGAAVSSAMTYDADSRVTGITHTYNGNTLASYALTWNNGNQLTREVSGDGTADFTYNTTGIVSNRNFRT